MPYYNGSETDPDTFQNWMLQNEPVRISFGYRLYATHALAQLPFECNSGAFSLRHRDYHSAVLKKFRILELPIPTFYGDEICHVNGPQYPSMFVKRCAGTLHQMNLFFDRKSMSRRRKKPTTSSSGYLFHTMAIDAARSGAHVLELAATRVCRGRVGEKGVRGHGMDRLVRLKARRKCSSFTGISIARNFRQRFPRSIKSHARHHRAFEAAGGIHDELRFATVASAPEVIITTPHRIFRDPPDLLLGSSITEER